MRFVFAALTSLLLVSPVSAQESRIGTWSVSIATVLGLGRSNMSIESAMLSAGYLYGCLCDNSYGPVSQGGGGIQVAARRRLSTRTHVRALASKLTRFETSAEAFTEAFAYRVVRADQRISTLAVLVGVNRAEPSLHGKHVQPWMAAGPAVFQPTIVSGSPSTHTVVDRITRIGGTVAAGLSLVAGGMSFDMQTDYRRVGTHGMAPIAPLSGGGPLLPVSPVDWNHFTVSFGLGLRW